MIITWSYETLRPIPTQSSAHRFENPNSEKSLSTHRRADLVSAKSRSRATYPPGASSGRTTFTKWPTRWVSLRTSRTWGTDVPKVGVCAPVRHFTYSTKRAVVCSFVVRVFVFWFRVWLSGDFLRVHARIDMCPRWKIRVEAVVVVFSVLLGADYI